MRPQFLPQRAQELEHWGDLHGSLGGNLPGLFGPGSIFERLERDLEDSQPGIGFANWHGKSYAVLTAPIVSIDSVWADYLGSYRVKNWNPIQRLDPGNFAVHAAGGISLSRTPQFIPNLKGGLIVPAGPVLKVTQPLTIPPMSKKVSRICLPGTGQMERKHLAW
ncbi:MAG: hypothetical protein FJW30_20860 [Acidobacteria bacterium]|nr:hypothetical protein [Acidobacteriota bacterium]